jgi:hypothetical protein
MRMDATPVAADGRGAVMAIIGGGVALHADLPSSTGYTCIRTAGDPGACQPAQVDAGAAAPTHAAGVVAARIGNGIGIVGVAPAVSLLDIRVVAAGVATASDVDAAIRFASSAGADVALVVLPDGVTGASPPPGARAVVSDAIAAGTIVVGGVDSAGDVLNGTDAVSVASLDRTDRQLAIAPTSSRWALAAPGGVGAGDPDRAVLSTGTDGGYAAMSGSWVAAAHVAAALAVLRGDGLDVRSAADRLVASGESPRAPGALVRVDLAAARGTPIASMPAQPAPTTMTAPTTRAPTTPVATARSAVPSAAIDAPPGRLPYALTARSPVALTASPSSVEQPSGTRSQHIPIGPLVVGALLGAIGLALAALVRAARPASQIVTR